MDVFGSGLNRAEGRKCDLKDMAREMKENKTQRQKNESEKKGSERYGRHSEMI